MLLCPALCNTHCYNTKIQFIISRMSKPPCVCSPVTKFNVIVWNIKPSGNYPFVWFSCFKDADNDYDGDDVYDNNNNNNNVDPDERSV